MATTWLGQCWCAATTQLGIGPVLVCGNHLAGPVPVSSDHSAGPVLVCRDHSAGPLLVSGDHSPGGVVGYRGCGIRLIGLTGIMKA